MKLSRLIPFFHVVLGRQPQRAPDASREASSSSQDILDASVPSAYRPASAATQERGMDMTALRVNASSGLATDQARVADFLARYGMAYASDGGGVLLPVVPHVQVPVAAIADNPDPRVFHRSVDRQSWVNGNPDPECYVYSSSKGGAYHRTKSARPEDVVFAEVVPRISAIVNPIDPKLEARIHEAEAKLASRVASDGMGALPGFAIRGISCSALGDDPSSGPLSLAAWKKRGYLSEGGGNFFVLHPGAGPKRAKAFMAQLLASTGSALRYTGRDGHPVVVFVEHGETFSVPASGGNDGIGGDYPLSLHVGGKDHHLRNLDVGCITRPTSKTSTKVGLVVDRVPETSVGGARRRGRAARVVRADAGLSRAIA